MQRCRWVNPKNPIYIKYHDTEWGVPSHSDGYLFEMLVLEAFQAGLSWECVLNKREAFREMLDGFDVTAVSRYTQADVDRLMSDARLIRNRRKIEAAITNAAVFISVQKEFGSFDKYIWGFTSGERIVNRDGVIRATSQLSDVISGDLKRRGMKFVGSTVIYSYLQAIGVIDDHEPQCELSRRM